MKVFVNDIPFVFEPSQKQQGRPSKEEATFANPSFEQIWQFYEMAKEQRIQGEKGLKFLVSDYDGMVEQWKSRFRVLHAAGGLVQKQGSILFIFRLSKWDLPKGKVEKGETIEEASVREVEEECGIKAERKEKVGETWHTYTDGKGREVLKCTHWFAMDCLEDQGLAPQTEENITEVAWLSPQQIEEKALANTYASIEDIYRKFQK